MLERLINAGRRALQETIILVARPYIRRELPGWGKVYLSLVGDYRRDSLWQEAPNKVIRGKFHGFLMHLDISHWGDRVAYFLGRWYELETQLFIRDLIRPGDTVVDIGANRGMFTLCASYLVGPRGKVISIEPNPGSRKQLERELESNGIDNVAIHSCGASNTTESLVLNVPIVNSGEASFGTQPENKNSYYQVHAQLVTGDSLLSDDQPVLIKIDVEGFECHVIEGLAEALKKHHPVILTEIAQEYLQSCGSSLDKLIGLMNSSGYAGYHLLTEEQGGHYTWTLKPIKKEKHAYNAVWVHERSPAEAVSIISRHIKLIPATAESAQIFLET